MGQTMPFGLLTRYEFFEEGQKLENKYAGILLTESSVTSKKLLNYADWAG